jgi:cyclic beta-1,2-glucan synthetase
VNLTKKQTQFLRQLSRKTWRYFETYVTEDENWLPPDNVQMNPHEVIAPRTSPTNIGMALLADLAAQDFGYISVGCLLDRTRKTFGTMARMERYRGHLFNWYDTRTLLPLAPQYVSTVDSGNLAGQLYWCSHWFGTIRRGQNSSSANLRWTGGYARHSSGRINRTQASGGCQSPDST